MTCVLLYLQDTADFEDAAGDDAVIAFLGNATLLEGYLVPGDPQRKGSRHDGPAGPQGPARDRCLTHLLLQILKQRAGYCPRGSTVPTVPQAGLGSAQQQQQGLFAACRPYLQKYAFPGL